MKYFNYLKKYSVFILYSLSLLANNQSSYANNINPIQDGLVSWVDASDGTNGDTIWRDRTDNNNNFILKNFDSDDIGFNGDTLTLSKKYHSKVESEEYVRILEGESYSLEIFFDGYDINYLIGLQEGDNSHNKGSFIWTNKSQSTYILSYDSILATRYQNFNNENNHVVLIKDAENLKLKVYLNTVLIDEIDIEDGDNGLTQKVQLASHYTGSYNSDIDIYSHRRYDKALTQAEIEFNYYYELLSRNKTESFDSDKFIAFAKRNATNELLIELVSLISTISDTDLKDELTNKLNEVREDMTLKKQTISSNMDIYIKSENMLSVSLDTNSVTFDNYSGVADMEKLEAVELTINSSLPYTIKAYMPVGISNSDKSSTIPHSLFKIRENNETSYQEFVDTTTEVVLKDNCIKGNDNKHLIDLKLSSNLAHKADVYKTVIRFEILQK